MQNIYANFARMQTHSNIIDSYKSIVESNISSYKLNSNRLITHKFLNIEISNLQFSYKNRKIFNNLDFSINRGNILYCRQFWNREVDFIKNFTRKRNPK